MYFSRTIAKYLVTVVPFLYWKYRGGATLSIFLANVQKHPAKVALHFGDEQWTFQQVNLDMIHVDVGNLLSKHMPK